MFFLVPKWLRIVQLTNVFYAKIFRTMNVGRVYVKELILPIWRSMNIIELSDCSYVIIIDQCDKQISKNYVDSSSDCVYRNQSKFACIWYMSFFPGCVLPPKSNTTWSCIDSIHFYFESLKISKYCKKHYSSKSEEGTDYKILRNCLLQHCTVFCSFEVLRRIKLSQTKRGKGFQLYLHRVSLRFLSLFRQNVLNLLHKMMKMQQRFEVSTFRLLSRKRFFRAPG